MPPTEAWLEALAQLFDEAARAVATQYSGAYADRPGINRMKKLGQAGEANIVISYRICC